MNKNNFDEPTDYKTEQKQTVSDNELFDKAKVDTNRIEFSINGVVNIIVAFAETLSQITFYKYERVFAKRIVYDLVAGLGSTITGEFVRQSGKSTTLGAIIPSCAIMLPLLAEMFRNKGMVTKLSKFERGFLCGVYGPDYDRAAIIGRKINETLTSSQSKAILSDASFGMTFPNKLSRYYNALPRGSRIIIKSANKRVSIEGDTHHLVCTDETQEISDLVLKKSISPMLASVNGTTVHIGSPYIRKVYFYTICRQNEREDLERSNKLRCHFSVNRHEVIKCNKDYEKYIKKEEIKLGKNSDEFRLSYDLYWIIEKGMFITEDFLINRIARPYGVTNFDKTNTHVVSIDLGKVNDSTVVTILEVDYDNPIVIDGETHLVRHNKKIKNWLELSGDDYDTQFYIITDFLKNYRWFTLIIDATGVGASMYDRFKAYYSNSDKVIVPFVFNRPDKSYGYSLLYRELLAERLVFPNSDAAKRLRKQQKFVFQLTNMSKKYEGGYMVVKHLDESGKDDYGDSLMMAVVAAERENSADEVEEIMLNIFKTEDRNIRSNDKNNFWNQNRE